MPLPVKTLPKPLRCTVSASVRANVGKFEHIEFTITEEYSVEGDKSISDTRKELLASIQDDLAVAGARFVEPLECSSLGANPAGQVACLFKNLSDQGNRK